MDGYWSVELGHEDPTLEFPWSAPDGSHRYVDLLRSPQSIREIPEATRYPELGECLLALNSPSSRWQTVKCDVWLDHELGEATQIYDAALKFCSYVDLVARDKGTRFSFDSHERFVKSAALQLSDDDGRPVTSEFIVRRCWYHPDTLSCDPTPGFHVTCYLFGYGNDENQAHARWAEGLRRVTSILAESAP
jgi:hypothetical protein